MNSPLHRLFDPGICPGSEMLKDYLAAKLKNDEVRFIELHLSNCEMCADEVDGMSMLNETEIKKHLLNIKNKSKNLIFKQKNQQKKLYYLLSIAASVLLFWGLFFIFNTKNVLQSNQLAYQKNEKVAESIQNEIQHSDADQITNKKKTFLNAKDLNPPGNNYGKSQTNPTKEEGLRPIENMLSAPNQMQATEFRAVLQQNKDDESNISGADIASQGEEHIIVKDKTGSNFIISGIVEDQIKIPLPGVLIQMKNSQNATMTDGSGRFLLDLQSDKNNEIIVSFLGYDSQVIKIKNWKDSLIVTLFESAIALDEVLVLGFAAQNKKSHTIRNTKSSIPFFKWGNKPGIQKSENQNLQISNWQTKAQTFELKNQMDSAMCYYKKIVEQAPKHIKAQLSIIYCYVSLEKYSMAIYYIGKLTELEQFTSLKPKLNKLNSLVYEEEQKKALQLLNQMRH